VEGTRSREAAALVGRTFGEFVVREPLGSGGFGMVFRAEQPALAREAVIKVLHTRLLASETVVQRFLREARLASRLDHPYAAHTYAFGAEPDGVLWIAMELVRGTPLDRMLLLQGPIPLERFVPLLERICEVVHTAHEQGIVHRDLKPGNVMVLARAGRLLPKLLDFGIAKLDDVAPPPADEPPVVSVSQPSGALDETIDPSADPRAVFAETAADPGPTVTPAPLRDAAVSGPPMLVRSAPERARSAATGGDAVTTGRLTHVGATMGSPLYMAPEQWSDAAAVGPPTDLYALGILCFEALTGKLPFNGETHMQIAMAHARQPVPPLGVGFPRSLDQVLARVLAKSPADRYGDALEFAAAFRTASGVASDPVSLPRLEERARSFAIARAQQPLARAVAALEAARNAHQARDALWQVVRVAVRLLGVSALAAHSHVRPDLSATDPTVGQGLRRLRGRVLSDGAWLELARELVAGFAELRDAHPIPELVDFLTSPASDPLDELLRLRAGAEEAGGGTDERVRELLELALPLVARLLDRISFLADYQLAVPDAEGAETWVGVGREQRPRRALLRRDLPAGRPVLLDATGAPVVALWPFVQVHVPAAGEPPALFFVEGRGRRGARLVALPDPFEHEDEELWDALGGMLGDTSEKESETTAEEVCPFPGLAPFTGAEAANFLGRERETEAFLNRLRVSPLLAVVGPSGAGKSSFVQAGVLPGLPDGWQSVTVRPGPAPLVSLIARLSALDAAELPALSGHGNYSPNALGSALRAAAARKRTTFVVVVDQLEELFTLCDDAGERERYAATLVGFARTPDDPVRVVLTLRDDFLLRAEAVAGFRARLAPSLQLLTTPAPAELKRILVEPLRRAGYEFDDPGLPDEMIEAVAETPSALALLSFTASKLWELRDRRFHQLGHKAYRSLGGVGGALAQHAESTLQAMRPEEQRLVREVFRHAVTAEGTRAVLSRGELDELLGAGGAAVVEKLVAVRLLVISETESGGERVEITHEALLTAWPRLVTWRREDAEGARLRDQLRAAARQWEERGRPHGLLWRGDALAEYRQWRARVPGALTAIEEAFTAASLADAARSRRVRRILLAVTIVALAAVAAVLFVLRRHAVDNERAATRTARDMQILLRSQYESQGRRLLLADDPVLALAYLHEASTLGATGHAHDYLLAEALAATDGERFIVRHDSGISRVRFSPDGARLLTTGHDNRARIWNAQSGALLVELKNECAVASGEWSPDGTLVATASDPNPSLSLWDASTGERRHQLALPAQVQALAFSPDGSLLLALTIDEAVTVWDPKSGQRTAVLREPAVETLQRLRSSAAWSPDGRQVAAGERSGKVTVWDARSGQVRASLDGHRSPVETVAFAPDSGRLVTSGADGKAFIWRLAGGPKLIATVAHPDPLVSASFSPDGGRVVTASVAGVAQVSDAASGAALLTLEGHTSGLAGAVYSPDGSQIATASDDGTAVLWDAVTGRRLARRVGHRGAIRDVAFDSSGTLLATASADGVAIVSDTRPARRVTFLAGHTGPIWWVEFSPAGSHVLTASQDKTVAVWDVSTGRRLMSLEHPTPVWRARYSPDGGRIATGGEDGVVRVWDAHSGRRLAELAGHSGLVSWLAWDADGARLASAAYDGTVRVWQVASRMPPLNVGGYGEKGAIWAEFAGPGQLVTAGGDDTVRVVDAGTGTTIRSFQDLDGRVDVSLDSTRRQVVSATYNRSARVWRLADGAPGIELLGHGGQVLRAVWSPRDRFLLTASLDGTARIWDARTGNLLTVLDHQNSWVLSAAFSPDGKLVATGRGDAIGTIWELPRFTASGGELERIIRCRVPYEIHGESVVGRPRDLAACRPRTPTR